MHGDDSALVPFQKRTRTLDEADDLAHLRGIVVLALYTVHTPVKNFVRVLALCTEIEDEVCIFVNRRKEALHLRTDNTSD